MKHRRRWIFRIATIVSCLLSLGVIFKWVRSYSNVHFYGLVWERWPNDTEFSSRTVECRFVWGHWILSYAHSTWSMDHADRIPAVMSQGGPSQFREKHPGGIDSYHGSFVISFAPQTARIVGVPNPIQTVPTPSSYLLQIPNWYGFGQKSRTITTIAGPDSEQFLMVPAWFPLLLTLVLPTMWTIRSCRARKRLRAGRCVECGYDLRATPDRCPECGAVSETAKGAAG